MVELGEISSLARFKWQDEVAGDAQQADAADGRRPPLIGKALGTNPVSFLPLTLCMWQAYTWKMADSWEELARCTGFQWDEANATKNWERHQVSQGECEQIFFNHPFVVAFDVKHSQDEPRYFGLGQSDAGRGPFVVFTIRGDLIRVISARDMSRRERKVYERTKEGG